MQMLPCSFTARSSEPIIFVFPPQSSADSYDLREGSASDLLNARVSGEMVSLVLMRYQGRDWHGHLRVKQELPEFFPVCLTCDSDASLTVDVNVHVLKTASCLTLSLFSPYWLINKTSRVLQYQADELSLKHPADLRDIVLFSFRKKNLFSKSKVRPNPPPQVCWSRVQSRRTTKLCELDSLLEFPGCDLMVCLFLQLQLRVSTSSWSDAFSLDTVGSYGCVRCPANNMDFLVRPR